MRLQHWREDMHTRGGASAWLTRRADNSCSLQQVLHWDVADKQAGVAGDRLASSLDPDTTQRATASELAGRWNAGLVRYRRDSARPPQLSKIAEAGFCTTMILPERPLLIPAAFPAGWLVTTLFTSKPRCEVIAQPWTPLMLAQFCPATETPGLDGWTPSAVRSLDEASAKMPVCIAG